MKKLIITFIFAAISIFAATPASGCVTEIQITLSCMSWPQRVACSVTSEQLAAFISVVEQLECQPE